MDRAAEQGRLQLSLNKRLAEIDAMGQVHSTGNLVWVGALLVVPEYEVPYLSGAAR